MAAFTVNYPEMVVDKSVGLTPSEQKLDALGYQTFLRLWSYPNPYKMQLNGKELCDLLIVFDNHIIIFSDKACAYGDSENPRVNWRRWYKRAIQKSAEQLVGAKKLYSQALNTVWAGLFPPFFVKFFCNTSCIPAKICLDRRENPSPIRHPPPMNTASKKYAQWQGGFAWQQNLYETAKDGPCQYRKSGGRWT